MKTVVLYLMTYNYHKHLLPVYEGVCTEPGRYSPEPPPPDVPWYRSCRVLLAFITAWGYVFFYLLRIDLSLAIVCMVRDPDIAAGDNSSDSGNGSISSGVRLCISHSTNWFHGFVTIVSVVCLIAVTGCLCPLILFPNDSFEDFVSHPVSMEAS